MITAEEKRLEKLAEEIGHDKVIEQTIEIFRAGLDQFLRKPSTTKDEAAVQIYLIEQFVEGLRE